MKFNLLSFLLFFPFFASSFAQLSPKEQKNVDSLISIVNNTRADTTRIHALLEWDNYIYYFDTELDLKLNERVEKICIQNMKNVAVSTKEADFYKKYYGNSLNNLGLIYRERGDHVRAIDYQTKSLKIKESMNDKLGVASSYNNIGLIYGDQGDLKKAIECHLKSLKISEEIKDKEGVAHSYGNLSTMYSSILDFHKALDYAFLSLKLMEEFGDELNVAGTNNNIAIIYQSLGDKERAIEYSKKGLEIFEKLGNKKGIASSLNIMGSISIDKKDYKATIKYCTRSISLAKDIEAIFQVKSASYSLYTAYKALGDPENALKMHEQYVVMGDSINNENNKKEIARQEFKYEYEKKAAADSVKMSEEKKVVALQFKQEQTQRYGLYGGVVLLIVFGAFMFNRFRVTKKQKNIIESQKEIVEAKQKEIVDSIMYAKRIQTALLPQEKYIDKSIKRLKG